MVQRKEQKLKFRKSEYLTGHLQNKATIILYSSIPLVAEVAATSVLTDVQLSVLVSTSESHSSETGKQQSHCNYICMCISISTYMYVCIVCDNYIYYCVCITSQLLCDIYIYITQKYHFICRLNILSIYVFLNSANINMTQASNLNKEIKGCIFTGNSTIRIVA